MNLNIFLCSLKAINNYLSIELMLVLIKVKTNKPILLHILMIIQNCNAIILKEHHFLALTLPDLLIPVRLAHINALDLNCLSSAEDKFVLSELGAIFGGVEVVSCCDNDVGGD